VFLVSEAYVKVEELLSEVKARVLSVPCPQCGGLQDEPVKPGEIVKCKYCGSCYSVENSLNETSVKALRNLVLNVVNDALGKYNMAMDVHLEELTNLLQDYTDRTFKETRNFYDALGRLPLRVELDKRLREGTQQILETMASSSRQLLDGQETISVKVDSVSGRIDSVRVSIKEIKKLLECISQTHGKDWHRIEPKGEVTLLYCDLQNQRRELHVRDVVIGRSERGWELEARSRDGVIECLGLTDLTVSRRHIKITVKEGTVTLMDLGSKNGTYINGRKIQPKTLIKLHNGDQIQIGLNTKFNLARDKVKK